MRKHYIFKSLTMLTVWCQAYTNRVTHFCVMSTSSCYHPIIKTINSCWKCLFFRDYIFHKFYLKKLNISNNFSSFFYKLWMYVFATGRFDSSSDVIRRGAPLRIFFLLCQLSDILRSISWKKNRKKPINCPKSWNRDEIAGTEERCNIAFSIYWRYVITYWN